MSMLKHLVRLGADINQPNGKGETALSIAVKRNDANVVRELLSLGADPAQVSDADLKRALKGKKVTKAPKTFASKEKKRRSARARSGRGRS